MVPASSLTAASGLHPSGTDPTALPVTGSTAVAYGSPGGAIGHFGTTKPSEVNLTGYPVIEVELVKIDGVVIPAAEYTLRNNRTLVRIRPTAESNPTQRWGWPTSQINDLPDTQPGTFSVTFTFGQAAPRMAWFAALALAERRDQVDDAHA